MDNPRSLAKELAIASSLGTSTDVERNTIPLSNSPSGRSQGSSSTHNAMQPIFSLPPEILGKILRHLRDVKPLNLRMIHPSTLRDQGRPLWFHRLGWVMITHVCRHLRNIALSDAELWSKITSTGICHMWLLELLGRSKDASIALDMQRPATNHPYSTLLVDQLRKPRNIRRVRSIKTTDMSPSATAFLQALFDHPAPLLEELDIFTRSIWGGSTIALPPTCFRSSAPRLRVITLDGVPFYWPSFKGISSLTHLTILGHRPSAEPRETPCLPASQESTSATDAFADCLRSLPLLRVLHLKEALPHASLAASRLCSHIALPNLERLMIEDVVTSCSWFLGSLDISYLDNILEIRAIVENMDEAESHTLSGLLHFISSYVPRMKTATGISEFQVYIKHDQLNIDVWPDLTFDDGEETEEDVNGSYQMYQSYFLSLWFKLPPANESDSFVRRYSLLHTMLTAFPLHNMRILRLAIDHKAAELNDLLDYHFWRRFYESCASTTRAIQVQGAATVTLLPLLATRAIPGWKLSNLAEPRPPLFPALRDLSVGEIASGHLEKAISRCIDSEAADITQRGQRHVAFVRECLATRAGHTPLLERLYVDMDEDMCVLEGELMESLQSIAKTVDSGQYDW